jgi:hypothetical protein
MENNQAKETPHLMPAIAVKSTATGMLMMAFFTLLWAGIAYGGLNGKAISLVLIIFPVLAVLFVINAIKLFGVAKHYPALITDADKAERKNKGMWFGIIFGAEGLGIAIAVNLVIYFGHPELSIPVIALVVGLHFYPMAKIFKRTIDYYLATWSTIIAICGIVFLLNGIFSQPTVYAFVGIGLALATSSYGLYMMISGWKIVKIGEAQVTIV